MKKLITYVTILISISIGLKSQTFSTFNIMLTKDYSNESILKIDSIILQNKKNTYKKYNLKADKKYPLFVIDKIIPDNYNVSIYCEGYNAFNKEFKVSFSNDLKYIERLKIHKDSLKYIYPCQNFPEYPGGFIEMKKFIKTNLNFDKINKELIGQYLYIGFKIDSFGIVKESHINYNLKYPSLEKEVERVISLMPKWKPGTQENGKKCEYVYFSYKMKIE
ncbi:MAG: hypothetical protein KAT68_03020 [Bacteroidales bacterium]|nr:hypothetical protein [Bacteroidales bacterium]